MSHFHLALLCDFIHMCQRVGIGDRYVFYLVRCCLKYCPFKKNTTHCYVLGLLSHDESPTQTDSRIPNQHLELGKALNQQVTLLNIGLTQQNIQSYNNCVPSIDLSTRTYMYIQSYSCSIHLSDNTFNL